MLAAPGAVPVDRNQHLLRPSSVGIVGNTADVVTEAKPGPILIGGGKEVEGAFRWMLERSGGGNLVILCSSGTDVYNSDVNGLGKVSSVETLKIDSRDLADNDTVVRLVSNAKMLFIADGDQSK